MFFDRKGRANADDAMAAVLADESLREKAERIRAVARDRDELAYKSSLLLGQPALAAAEVAAARARYEQTLELEDLESCVVAMTRASALAALQANGGMMILLPSIPEAACVQRWRERNPDRERLAADFLAELRPRLVVVLEASIATDRGAAAALGFKKGAETEATTDLREKIKYISSNSFATAEHVAQTLFNNSAIGVAVSG